jgi:hypothetical protein
MSILEHQLPPDVLSISHTSISGTSRRSYVNTASTTTMSVRTGAGTYDRQLRAAIRSRAAGALLEVASDSAAYSTPTPEREWPPDGLFEPHTPR